MARFFLRKQRATPSNKAINYSIIAVVDYYSQLSQQSQLYSVYITQNMSRPTQMSIDSVLDTVDSNINSSRRTLSCSAHAFPQSSFLCRTVAILAVASHNGEPCPPSLFLPPISYNHGKRLHTSHCKYQRYS